MKPSRSFPNNSVQNYEDVGRLLGKLFEEWFVSKASNFMVCVGIIVGVVDASICQLYALSIQRRASLPKKNLEKSTFHSYHTTSNIRVALFIAKLPTSPDWVGSFEPLKTAAIFAFASFIPPVGNTLFTSAKLDHSYPHMCCCCSQNDHHHNSYNNFRCDVSKLPESAYRIRIGEKPNDIRLNIVLAFNSTTSSSNTFGKRLSRHNIC